jgi:hypothetical protein
MPMHDWKKVRAGTFHNFHVLWLSTITNRLNAGVLPAGYFAMAEQIIGGPEPDVVTLKLSGGASPPGSAGGAIALAEPKPKPSARFVMTADGESYARKANRIVVRHELGDVLAVIEIVSPGNKISRHAIRSLVDKSVELLFQGISLLIVDPLPPTPRDPQGLHPLIWGEVTDQPFELPADQPLTIAAYQAEPIKTAYVEPIAVGQPLPTMPLFLQGEYYVDLPLEQTYQQTWDVLPKELRRLVE